MQFKQQENVNFHILQILTLGFTRLVTKVKFRNNICAGLFLACLGFIATSQVNAAYTFTDLSTLGGTNSYVSYATAINDSGQVVGYSNSTSSPYLHATIWSGATVTDLGVPGESSYATAINASGQVAGYSFTERYSAYRATVWNGTTATYLGTLSSNSPPYSMNNYAYGINSSGQVAGFSYNTTGSPFYHATVWNGTKATELDTLGGVFSAANATAINDSGEVAGYSTITGNTHATVWNGTTATDLGTLGSDSYAYAINASGQVAGVSNQHATVWNGTIATDLGTLGGSSSGATAINTSGQVVGGSELIGSNTSHATLWNGTTATDLNSLLDASTSSAGWVLTYATGINDNGWIVGNASNSLLGISQHAFLLSVAAVPEPESYAMLIAGIALIGFTTRRRNCFGK